MHVIAKSNKILVKPDEAMEKTAGGILIPLAARKGKYEKGEIVDIAQMLPDGHDEIHEVNVGDRIAYNSGGVIKVGENEEFDLVPYSSVLVKL